MENIDKYTEKGIELAIEYAPKVLLAIVTLIIGWWVINMIVRLIGRGISRSNMDDSLQPFLKTIVGVILKLMLFISVAEMVGVETTSFVAVVGAAGLAIGLALQGSLSNFAGGMLILTFKPFRVGDLVDIQGEIGHVKEIQIFNTILHSPQDKTVILPNGMVSNGVIVNLTKKGRLRVDLTVGIAYDEDIRKAREAIMNVMMNDELVLKDPAPSVHVSELADSSVNLAVRPYATPENYWAVYFGTLEKSKQALDAAGITIPFPQRDVHMIKGE